MVILVVGADSKYAIERPYIHYLKQNEAHPKVFFFRAQNIFLEYYHRHLINKILYRLGWHRILKKINRLLQAEIDQVSPDVILLFKGMEVFPKTLRYARDRNIKLVNYNPDSPFIFSGKGSGNKNISQSIRLYDLYLTYDKGIEQKLIQQYKIKSSILPFGFELSYELYQQCGQQEEIRHACFIGNSDQFRVQFINAIAQAGVAVHVYGIGWKRYSLHANVVAFDAAYGDDFWRVLRKYRVQLNLMRPHNPESHNMRTFEIPAVGGIQLAPKTADHCNYFSEGKEIFVYENTEDCVRLIGEIISLPDEYVQQVRAAARKRSMESGYSYAHRANTLYDKLEGILR